MKPANDNTRNTSPLMTGMSRGDVWFGTVLTLSAALAIVLGLLITDAPWMVRKRQADQIRVNALMAMNNDIPRFAAEKGALPHNLTELNQFG